ncbi:MAG TPA: hypothetical protein VGN79_12185 [Devosia sp.]|nr:hypothetical protein [Devosia sp.]
MAVQRDTKVTEFVIISGPEVHDYLVEIRAQLRSYLNSAFPDFRFSLVSQDGEGMGFVVVPVVGSIGDGTSSGDFADPEPSVLYEIKQALEAFRPCARTVH